MSRRAVSCSAGGFGLLELVIVFAISLVALTIATGILVEAERRASRAAEDARQAPIDLVLRQLRADLRASAGVADGEDLWSREPLVLAGHPAGALRYEVVEGDLQRIAGVAPAGRVVLPRATLFRWRVHRLGKTAVEVELGRFERQRLQAVTGPAGVAAGVERLRRWVVLATPRAAGGVSW